MHSYVQNLQIQAHAVKDPKLLGEPFIDLEGQKFLKLKTLSIKLKKIATHLFPLIML